jgi:hypothetical protein
MLITAHEYQAPRLWSFTDWSFYQQQYPPTDNINIGVLSINLFCYNTPSVNRARKWNTWALWKTPITAHIHQAPRLQSFTDWSLYQQQHPPSNNIRIEGPSIKDAPAQRCSNERERRFLNVKWLNIKTTRCQKIGQSKLTNVTKLKVKSELRIL